MPNESVRDHRSTVMVTMVVVGFGLIVTGLLQLQVVHSDRYRELSESNSVRREIRRAPRGVIRDRFGAVLADNQPGFNVVFRPFPAESTARRLDAHWLEEVADLCEVDTAIVLRAVRTANASGQVALLRRTATMRVVAAVEEMRPDLPGIEVVVEPLRRYPHGMLAAHLLGYANQINDSELETLEPRGYRLGDLIGRSGVERSYEEVLRGQDGWEDVVVNAMGRPVAGMTLDPPTEPVPGQNITLTLDLKLQRALEQAMAGVRRGAAVALDVRDGGILAAVSRPAYDPNEFALGLSVDRWRQLSSGGDNPLLNRVVQGLYPPGSTFKVVTMVAGLRARVVSPSTRMTPCPGGYEFGGRFFHCWERAGHGSLDLTGALAHSCDVYFYQLGILLGLPRLEAAARAFGLGERTGVDLPEEKKGLIPNVAWYDRQLGARRWRKGLLLNLAIGQGEILTTPLQLALLAAESANGGRPLRPHIVRPGPGRDTDVRPIQPGVTLDAAAWRAVQRALEQAVSDGTGGRAKVPGVRVGGKTGTAQNPHGNDHALFICYAPADDPQVALAIVVENGGHGGSTAAPIAGNTLRAYYLPDTVLVLPSLAAAPDSTYHGD
jgi:penicillin-binding protein 2